MTTPSPSPLFAKKVTPTLKDTSTDWLFPYPGSVVRALSKHCPPWYDEVPNGDRGHHGCKRDSANLATRNIRPTNRCGKTGECLDKACVIFNGKSFYPENSPAGFCIRAGAGEMGLNYIEFAINAIKGNHWDWIYSARWAQQDSPEVLTCQSFCTGGPEPNKDARWSGQHGLCKCHCVSGSSAGQFDRCTSVSKQVCTDAQYCGGHGTATWVKSQNARCDDEGQCSCACKGGWSGRSCELAPGTPCNMNDCNHFGEGSGTRPNCRCKCGSKFKGSTCSYMERVGGKQNITVLTKSTLFRTRTDACVDSARLCPKWAKKFRNSCQRSKIKSQCAFSCQTLPSCKWMPKNWWVMAE